MSSYRVSLNEYNYNLPAVASWLDLLSLSILYIGYVCQPGALLLEHNYVVTTTDASGEAEETWDVYGK